MQKRSPAKVLALSFLTLGAYDLIWFAKTRKALVVATGIRIPSIAWLVALSVFRVAALTIAVLLFTVLNASGGTYISHACQSQYILSIEPETSATHSLSARCRNQVKNSNAASRHRSNATRVLWTTIMVLLMILSWPVYRLWLRSYVRAIVQVTNGRLNETSAYALLYVAPSYGIPIVQQALNDPASLPALFGTFQTQQLRLPAAVEGNKTLKRILLAIAVTMAAVFVLFLSGLIALSYFAEH